MFNLRVKYFFSLHFGPNLDLTFSFSHVLQLGEHAYNIFDSAEKVNKVLLFYTRNAALTDHSAELYMVFPDQ